MSDIVEVIKQKSPMQQVILVGHDWGGAVAWHVARVFPDLLKIKFFKIKFFPDVGHFIQQEKPNIVAEEIMNFL